MNSGMTIAIYKPRKPVIQTEQGTNHHDEILTQSGGDSKKLICKGSPKVEKSAKSESPRPQSSIAGRSFRVKRDKLKFDRSRSEDPSSRNSIRNSREHGLNDSIDDLEASIRSSASNPLERLRRHELRSFHSVESSGTHDTMYDGEGARLGDVFSCCFRVITYMVDVGTDLFLTYEYYDTGHKYWFAYTLSFILVPSIIMSIFALVLYIRDWRIVGVGASMSSWLLRMFFLVLQLAPLIRIIESCYYAIKSRIEKDPRMKREYYERWLDEDTDSMLLRLFEAFLEAAPQLVLQIYILCKLRIVADSIVIPVTVTSSYNSTELMGTLSSSLNFSTVVDAGPLQSQSAPSIALQMTGLLTSWLTMTSTIVSFQKSLRLSQPKKAKLRFLGAVTMFFWRLFMIASRVMALALFGSVRGFDLFWVIGAHWGIMLMWMWLQETDYCTLVDDRGKQHRSPVLEFGFRGVTAFIHIFCFFNLIEGHTRLRCVTYYLIVYIENVAMVATWYCIAIERTGEVKWYFAPALLIVLVGFWVGISFQVLYYMCFHPNQMSPDDEGKRIRCCISLKDTHMCKEIPEDP